MRKALVLAVSAGAIFVAGSMWLALFPGVPPDLGGVPNLDGVAQRVGVPLDFGDHLDGWLLRGARPGVIVLLHGYGRDHHHEWRYAQSLRRDGWTLLAVDFRSSRGRRRKPTTLGFYELEDARSTLDWLEHDPRTAGQPIGLFGESLGGAVAIALAAERPEVAALAVDSPFANGRLAIADAARLEAHVPAWPTAPLARLACELVTGRDPYALDAVAALRRYGNRPLLLVQSAAGDRIGLGQVDSLEQAAGAHAERWRVPDAGHNRAWSLHRVEYERRLRAFFRRALT
ncbi:MAG TPA: alpha/beta hydrolase [Candidatus Acidoferrales bacterium]|nr:alpha/beta hydrolase [Candidatus Acidoferrales bacterium]